MVKKSPNNGSTAARSVGSNRPRKTMIVVTSEMTASMFVSGFAKRLSDWGDEVVVIANSTRDLVQELEGTGIRAVSVPMHRDPHPLADLVSLVRLVKKCVLAPVWSGSSAGKVRLNRGGNRSVNCTRKVLISADHSGPGDPTDVGADEAVGDDRGPPPGTETDWLRHASSNSGK